MPVGGPASGRQLESRADTTRGRDLDRDGSAVQLGQIPDDRQAEPRRRVTRAFGAVPRRRCPEGLHFFVVPAERRSIASGPAVPMEGVGAVKVAAPSASRSEPIGSVAASALPSAASAERRAFALAALGGALGLALLVGLATWPPGTHLQLFEFGHWLGPASDMLHGKIPYRDTFPIHGFLADGGFDYLLFRVVGPSFAASVWFHQALGTLFQPAIYLVAACITRRPLLCLALTPLTLALTPGLIFDRAVLPLLGLAVFSLAISDKPSKATAFVAGAMAVLGVFDALEFGTFVLAGELVCVAVHRIEAKTTRREALIRDRNFLSGVAAAGVLGAIVLACAGALRPFLQTSFVDLPFRIEAVWGLGFPSPLRLLRGAFGSARPYEIPGSGPIGIDMAVRLYLVPIAAALGISAIWVSRRRRVDAAAAARLLAVTVTCALLFRYVFARFHYEAGNALVGPTVLAAGILLVPRKPTLRRGFRIAAAAVAIAAVGLLGGIRLTAGIFANAATIRRRLAACPGCVAFRDARGGGIRVPADELAELRSLRALVEANAKPGGMLDLSNRPALYFFLDRVNPTRFYQVPMMEFFQDEVIADLKRTPPACVLLQPGSPADAPDGRSSESRIPRVRAYVTEHFPRTIRAGEDVLALPLTSRTGT